MSSSASFAREADRAHKLAVSGMLSAVAFVLMFLDFSLPFLIPGLVIGGAILYHTRLFDDVKKLSAQPEPARSGGMERRA